MISPELRALRAELQDSPEPANEERETARIIEAFLASHSPDALHTGLGGHGVAAVYEGRASGPTVLVRAELDALAVEGEPRAAAHRCGHDAHMTMVAALAPRLSEERPERGRVVLLFQPAEETGEGAARVIDDPRFASIRPDAAIALHNLPGYPRGAIVSRAGGFNSASVGMRAVFRGEDAHAGEPEQARSPALAIARLIEEAPRVGDGANPFCMATVTHATLGRPSFGTTPGHGELWATLRAGSTDSLDALCADVERRATELASEARVELQITWRERFPDTSNDPVLHQHLLAVGEEGGIEVVERDEALRWSEDFGHFGRICPSLLFGLGVGEDAPALHTPDYLFPDALLSRGAGVHWALAHRILQAGCG